MIGEHGNINIVVPENIKGLIFDCDGTLVDSMPLHMEAWDYAMQEFGTKYDEEFFLSKRGMKETEIIEQYNALFKTNIKPLDVVNVKHRFFSEHIHGVKAIPSVVKLVERFQHVLPMAVVSGSVRNVVVNELKIIGIGHLFKIILTADDSFKQKPAPDMFLEAARVMNVAPSQCQVFEDGDLGLLAAVNAGMLATDVRPFLLK
jgi:HAD superfamily hydrolase (TIGR01509 family)